MTSAQFTERESPLVVGQRTVSLHSFENRKHSNTALLAKRRAVFFIKICQKTLCLVEYQSMKTDIHPKYYPTAKATCACGSQMTVGSTKESIEMEICSQCHPLFTGMEKVMDTAGRVEKFKARRAAATPKKGK